MCQFYVTETPEMDSYEYNQKYPLKTSEYFELENNFTQENGIIKKS